VQTRRRLPVIAGTVLSAVIIAAPAAQADDIIILRQDCSTTIVHTADSGGIVGRLVGFVEDRVENVEYFLIGSSQKTENVRLPGQIMGDKLDAGVRDSFNCSNFFDRDFKAGYDNSYYNDNEDHGKAQRV
jgi:hypothetical protein